MLIADINQSVVMQTLPLALDAASLRHQVIAANIANANNSGWRAQKLSFEESLQAALAANGGPLQNNSVDVLQAVKSTVLEDSGESGSDAQVMHLSRNVLHYQALIKVTSAQLELLSMASNDGRR
jgi:flagellar basal-body rod protein FlgB